MSQVTILTGAFAVVFLGAMVELLRRRQLREKYAVLWLTTAVVVFPVAVAPGVFDSVARALDVSDGANLVLFLAVVFLLLVVMHLSWESSRLEEETRVLAEEVALLRTHVEGNQHGQ